MIPENYTCDNQLTIFDFLTPAAVGNIENMTEKEIIAAIEERTGLTFDYNSYFAEYEHREKGNLRITISKSRYEIGNHDAVILLGIDLPKEGYGGPCDSVEETIDKIKKLLPVWREKAKEKK